MVLVRGSSQVCNCLGRASTGCAGYRPSLAGKERVTMPSIRNHCCGYRLWCSGCSFWFRCWSASATPCGVPAMWHWRPACSTAAQPLSNTLDVYVATSFSCITMSNPILIRLISDRAARAKSSCRIAARVAGARCSGNNGRWSDLCGKSY